MSQITGRVGVFNPFQPVPPTRVEPEVEPTGEHIEALVARAKGVIARRIPGPKLTIPQHVEDFFAAQAKTFPFEPDSKVWKEMKEEASLEAIYQGELVAVIRDMNDDLTVLAIGSPEVFPMLQGLSWPERSKILVRETS